MKAMIFAAGSGTRMRPLTENCPKPLLKVGGRSLIVWHILNLVRAGITEIVINLNYLGQMIEQELGNGERFGAQISYSHENQLLETAGGLAFARDLLGPEPFVAISADIYCPHFDFSQVFDALQTADMWGVPWAADKRDVAWLYLVPNPPEHPEGDFALNLFSLANQGTPRYTYSGISVLNPAMFSHIQAGECVKLVTVLRDYADKGLIGGDVYRGTWVDVGTPERLEQLNKRLS